ncbi:MAG: hypothetical protein NC337_02760 [Roseburia sp.]|nr:hypothetical protein [Roseburia sp.]
MIWNRYIKNIAVVLACAFVLSGCGASWERDTIILDMDGERLSFEETWEAASEEEVSGPESLGGEDTTQEVYAPETSQEIPTEESRVSETQTDEGTLPYSTETRGAEELLDAFLAGELPAIYDAGEESEGTLMISDLPFDVEDDWFSYSIGERVDLDNDGENEQILAGPYGGTYFDARDGRVYILAQGEGTAGVLSYTEYENATWIVHRDTSHAGRQMYWLTKYDGAGNIVDEFQLSAEYWDSPTDKYDENSEFTFRDEKISMKEYEALRKEIIGW